MLGSLKYKNEELYSVGKPIKEVFWLPVDLAWFKIPGLKVRDSLYLSSIASTCLCRKLVPIVKFL